MATASAPAPDDLARRRGRSALAGRLAAAHLVCYPLMFVAAAAGMSLAIVLQRRALEAAELVTTPSSWFQRWLVAEVSLTVSEAAVFDVIMRPVGWALLAIFVVGHAASVPWALAARRAALGQGDEAPVRRYRRLWLASTVGLTVAVTLAGLVGWGIILIAPG